MAKTLAPFSPQTLRSTDPRTGEVLAEIPSSTPDDVRTAVKRARAAFAFWSQLPVKQRLGYLTQVRHAIHGRMDEIIDTVSSECGKPKAEALADDVLPAVLTLAYYERVTQRALKPERVGRIAGPVIAGTSHLVEWRPFGVIGCISPWNYPFNLAYIGLVPALAAGNTVVLKPSEATPRVGELIRDLLAPLPPGVVQVVQGGPEVGAALVDAPVDKISFIGSGSTGRKIAAAAAKHLTPVVMELGGKDSAIVCADADLGFTSSGVVWGAFFNCGQTCASIERVYVVDSIADEFVKLLVDKTSRLQQGRGDYEVGPLTVAPQLEVAKRHVADAVAKGARLLLGGADEGKPNTNGSLWFHPTILEDVPPGADLVREETFGPVLPVVRVKDEDEAVRRANEDGFNLTASVWTRDKQKGRNIASRLRAGVISLNEHGVNEALPWTPWGGVGESGYGRLNGVLALREFTVPVHVSTRLTRMKSLWWYPYDRATVTALRATTDAISAPTTRQKLRAVRTLLGELPKAIRGKL